MKTRPFFIFLFFSCQSEKEGINNIDFKTIIVDSCEYIMAKAPYRDFGWVMSHKGNCKYCAERSKK